MNEDGYYENLFDGADALLAGYRRGQRSVTRVALARRLQSLLDAGRDLLAETGADVEAAVREDARADRLSACASDLADVLQEHRHNTPHVIVHRVTCTDLLADCPTCRQIRLFEALETLQASWERGEPSGL